MMMAVILQDILTASLKPLAAIVSQCSEYDSVAQASRVLHKRKSRNAVFRVARAGSRV